MYAVKYLINEIQEMLFYKSVAERIKYNKSHPEQKNITADKIKSKYGITDEELSALPDVEIDYESITPRINPGACKSPD